MLTFQAFAFQEKRKEKRKTSGGMVDSRKS